MKIKDLLNKITNNEKLPNKIKYNEKVWRLASNRTYFIGSDYGYDFWVEHSDDNFIEEIKDFNDEIEILEDDNTQKVPLDKIEVFTQALTEEQIKKAMTNKSIFEITLEEKDKEIERLNNIIDELEKFLKRKIKFMKTLSIERMVSFEDCLDELKELKEGK